MGKAKIAIISLLIGAAAVAVPYFMQQQTLNALRHENDTLKEQAAQVASLQEQLAKATQDVASVDGSAESQARTLARLRAEVVELRKKTNELAKAQQQISMLNDRVAAAVQENQGIRAAVQADEQKRQTGRGADICVNNLRIIDSAKQQWALEQKKTAADVPTWDDLRPYLGIGPNAGPPACPVGGTYTIGAVGQKPTCTVANHVLQ